MIEILPLAFSLAAQPIGTPHILAAQQIYEKALTEVQSGEWQKGESDFAKTIEIEPTYLDSYDALARTLIEHGQIDEACRALIRLLQIEPRDETHRVTLGNLLLMSHEHRRALAQFSIVLSQNSGSADALFGFAQAAEALGMSDRFLSAMAKGRRTFPADQRFLAHEAIAPK